MLPTTYRGDATIDGERLDAQLRLDDDRVRLVTGRHAELLNWPLNTVGVESRKEGGYLLKAGADSFEFSPFVDDGLGEEIALRSRFAGVDARFEPEPEQEPAKLMVSDRIRSASVRNQNHRRGGVLAGGDLALRTALVVLGILALVVVTVALVSGAFDRSANPVVVAPEVLESGDAPSVTTLPFTEATAPAPTSPAPTVAPPTTTATQTPSTSAPASPPPTTPTTVSSGSASMVPGLDLTGEQLVARWNAVSERLGGVLAAEAVTSDGSAVAFSAGDWVDIQGQIGPDGTLDMIRMLGDPNGSRSNDRMVITAMGMVAAVTAPDLEPLGRRAMLEEMGFDFEDPDLAGLDGSLTYQEAEYRLRWDPDLARIVFEASAIDG